MARKLALTLLAAAAAFSVFGQGASVVAPLVLRLARDREDRHPPHSTRVRPQSSLTPFPSSRPPYAGPSYASAADADVVVDPMQK
jgi:hypothetical protein